MVGRYGDPPGNWIRRVPPFKVTKGHWNRQESVGTYDKFLLQYQTERCKISVNCVLYTYVGVNWVHCLSLHPKNTFIS